MDSVYKKEDLNKTLEDIWRRHCQNTNYAMYSLHFRHNNKQPWEDQTPNERIPKYDWDK